jgi:tetratricopeptide (TPR) repeat protein
MIRLHRLSALLAVVLLASCATGPGSDSSFNYRDLDDRDSGLAYAIRFSVEVRDAGDRAALLADIARRYAELGMPSQAEAVRAFAGETVATSAEDAAVSPAAVELARAYLAEGRTARATMLLDAAVTRIGALDEPLEQARVLEDIIELCFEAGDELFDVLRRAIEAVFVVEDLGRRVEILTDAAIRYQAQGVRQSANVLIQQSIPAAGNISEPWTRAGGFAAVAEAYRAIEESERAERMIGDAIAAARGADEAPPEAAAVFLSRLISLGRRLDALDLAEGIERPESRAAVLSTIAERYDTEELRSSAFILYARAVSAAGTVPQASGRASAYLRVAESYLRFGETQLAVIQGSNAVRSLVQVDPARRDAGLMLRLADLFIAADTPSELASVVDLAASPATEARIAAHIAVAAEDAYVSVAADNLERATTARAAAGEGQNTASRDIVRAAARLGRFDEALAELAVMDNARRISAAVTALGYEAMRAGGLSDAQRSALEELYRAYRQRQRLG